MWKFTSSSSPELTLCHYPPRVCAGLTKQMQSWRLEFRLPWPASLEDCLNEWCRYTSDHTPPRRRGQHFDAHLQPERLPVVLSHDYRLSFLRPQTEHQAVRTIPRMQRCLQQRTRARRRMGANASCVQLKIDGILESRLAFSSPVFIWMVNSL